MQFAFSTAPPPLRCRTNSIKNNLFVTFPAVPTFKHMPPNTYIVHSKIVYAFHRISFLLRKRTCMFGTACCKAIEFGQLHESDKRIFSLHEPSPCSTKQLSSPADHMYHISNHQPKRARSPPTSFGITASGGKTPRINETANVLPRRSTNP